MCSSSVSGTGYNKQVEKRNNRTAKFLQHRDKVLSKNYLFQLSQTFLALGAHFVEDGWGVQVRMRMGKRRSSGRRQCEQSFAAHLHAARLLFCGPVPNRLWTGTGGPCQTPAYALSSLMKQVLFEPHFTDEEIKT